MATMTQSLSTIEQPGAPDYLPPVNPKAVEQAMLIGDISQMTDEQRIAYYVAVCRSLHLNPLTKPFQALKGDDGKISLYPDKGCAEQLRKQHRVSVRVTGREFLDDLYIVTVEASTPDGRVEESQGVVVMTKPKGTWEDYEYRGQQRRRFKPVLDNTGNEVTTPLSATERATAIMRCETKAKRRVTLAICGLGLPDWEREPDSTAHPMALNLQGTYETTPDERAALAPPERLGTRPVADTIEELCGEAEPGKAALITQIDTLLTQQGLPPEGQQDWWQRMQEKYGDHTVATLTRLLEKLQQKMTQQTATPQTTGPDLMQQEEEEARRAEEARQLTLDQS